MADSSVDQLLMDFVVKLAANDTFRAQYERADKAGRRQLMVDARLSQDAITAIETQNESKVENMLNKQVAGGGKKF